MLVHTMAVIYLNGNYIIEIMNFYEKINKYHSIHIFNYLEKCIKSNCYFLCSIHIIVL